MRRLATTTLLLTAGLLFLTACGSPQQKAARDLERQLKQRKDSQAASQERYRAGLAAYHDERMDDALMLFNKAVEFDSGNVAAHIGSGIVAFHLEQTASSIDAFRRAAELAPSYYEPRYNLGTVFEMIGQYDEAIRQYNTALALNPESLEVKENLARALVRSGAGPEKIKPLFEDILTTETRQDWRKWIALQSFRIEAIDEIHEAR